MPLALHSCGHLDWYFTAHSASFPSGRSVPRPVRSDLMISVPSFPNHGFAVFPALRSSYTRGPLLGPLLPSPSGSLLSQSKVQSRPLSPADPSEAPRLDAPASPPQPDLAGRPRVSFHTCLTPRPTWPCAHPYIYFSMPLTVLPLPRSHLLLHLILKLYHPERFCFYLPRIPKQVLSSRSAKFILYFSPILDFI